MTTRTLLTVLVAAALAVGLAGPAWSGIPITLDKNDGYTFSGFFDEGTIITSPSGKTSTFFRSGVTGPTTVAGHQSSVALTWMKSASRFYPTCDPSTSTTITRSDITDLAVVHFMAAGVAPGNLTGVEVVVPSFTNSGGANTAEFPISELGVSVTITWGDGSMERVSLAPSVPPDGAAASYRSFFDPPLPQPPGGQATVDVELTGLVEPPFGNPVFLPQGCPPPNEDLLAFSDSGQSQIILQNMFVRLLLEEEPAPVVHPAAVTVLAGETQDFFAFDCERDANGNPDFGTDGVPGTPDDLCRPATGASWSVSGSIGTVSPASGSSTTLTASAPAGSLAASGQVVAMMDGRTAISNVTVDNTSPTVSPAAVTVRAGGTQDFFAFECERDANGNPDFGTDGVPGTPDDLCRPATGTSWSVSGNIGTVSPASGSGTTLTAADVAPGAVKTGQVIATSGDRQAVSNVTVHGPLPVGLVIEPGTINLKARGNYMTGTIESSAFDPIDIELVALSLQAVSPVVSSRLPIAAGAPTAVGDANGNGIPDLTVKFERATVQSWFPGAAEATFRITGMLTDGRRFQGDACVRVIDQGSQHTNENDHGSVQP